MIRTIIAIIALLMGTFQTQADEPVEIRLIGNMGVLISQGESKVLIDALFTDVYNGSFRVPTTEDREAMVHGTGEFEGVLASLSTHQHGDHFNAGETAAFLVGNPESVVGLTAQSEALLQAALEIEIDAERIMIASGDYESTSSGFSLEAHDLFHREGIENTTYAVTLGETTILHLGDTNPDQADFSVWDGVQIDVLLYPYWFAQAPSGQALLNGRFADARKIALHLPARATREQALGMLGEGNFLIEAGDIITISDGRDD